MEEIMPFDRDELVQDRFIDDRELRQDKLDTVSGGKPARNSQPRLPYFEVELKQVVVTSYN